MSLCHVACASSVILLVIDVGNISEGIERLPLELELEDVYTIEAWERRNFLPEGGPFEPSLVTSFPNIPLEHSFRTPW